MSAHGRRWQRLEEEDEKAAGRWQGLEDGVVSTVEVTTSSGRRWQRLLDDDDDASPSNVPRQPFLSSERLGDSVPYHRYVCVACTAVVSFVALLGFISIFKTSAPSSISTAEPEAGWGWQQVSQLQEDSLSAEEIKFKTPLYRQDGQEKLNDEHLVPQPQEGVHGDDGKYHADVNPPEHSQEKAVEKQSIIWTKACPSWCMGHGGDHWKEAFFYRRCVERCCKQQDACDCGSCSWCPASDCSWCPTGGCFDECVDSNCDEKPWCPKCRECVDPDGSKRADCPNGCGSCSCCAA